MVASISSVQGNSSVYGAANGQSSVALEDKLAKCVRQLADWQACPSAKTPEGKKIIQNLETQIRNVQSRIDSTTNRSTS